MKNSKVIEVRLTMIGSILNCPLDDDYSKEKSIPFKPGFKVKETYSNSWDGIEFIVVWLMVMSD